MSSMLKAAVSNSMKKAGPKRCLFGVPDHVALKSALDEQMSVLDKDNKSRWNFDFVNNKPLVAGNYHWTPITPVKTPRRVLVPKLSDITQRMVSLKNIESEQPTAPTTPTKTSSVQTSSVGVKCALSEAFTSFAKSSNLGIKRKRSANDITGK